MAIGIKALMKGYKVLFTPVSEMLHNLNAAKADNTYSPGLLPGVGDEFESGVNIDSPH